MTTYTDFGRVITAMITPFRPDTEQSIDWEALENLANHLLKNGSDSLLLAGSTGEAAQLTPQEKSEILRRVRQSVPAQTSLIVSTGDTNTKRAIDKTLQAFDPVPKLSLLPFCQLLLAEDTRTVSMQQLLQRL